MLRGQSCRQGSRQGSRQSCWQGSRHGGGQGRGQGSRLPASAVRLFRASVTTTVRKALSCQPHRLGKDRRQPGVARSRQPQSRAGGVEGGQVMAPQWSPLLPSEQSSQGFFCLYSCCPHDARPHSNEQPALQHSVTSLVPRWELQTCEAQAVPQQLSRHASQGRLSCASECDELLPCLCSPGKANELPAEGTAQPGWPAPAGSLPKVRDGWWQSLVPRAGGRCSTASGCKPGVSACVTSASPGCCAGEALTTAGFSSCSRAPADTWALRGREAFATGAF